MKYKAVFFDLDGTVLPLEQDYFIKTYFTKLAAYMSKFGYDPGEYVKSIMKCTGVMLKNDGARTNEEVFWEAYCRIYGESAINDEPVLEKFYKNDFNEVRAVTGCDPAAVRLVRALRAAGVIVVLATSPVFPNIATETRIRWAGLTPDDFDYWTTYNNSRYCKPNPEYYKDLLRRFDLAPEETLMVGNDTDDDMIAKTLGMDVFLIPEHLVNRRDVDISVYPSGSFTDLENMLLG